MAIFINHQIIISLSLEISLSIRNLYYSSFNWLPAFVQKSTKELEFHLLTGHPQSESFGKY